MARVKTEPVDPVNEDELSFNLDDTPIDACTVGVTGISQDVLRHDMLRIAFVRVAKTDSPIPVDFELKHESIWDTCLDGVLRQFPLTCLVFKRESDADYVLGLGNLEVWVSPRLAVKVRFLPTRQNSATRVAYRKVSELMERIEQIEKEYTALEVVREYPTSKPTLPGHWVSKSTLMQPQLLPAMMRKRKAGQALDPKELSMLKAIEIVDLDSIIPKIDALYNEECDAWLTLRRYQITGLKFKTRK